MAPRRAAAARSAGSGDQPNTRAMPARLACSATEPPIAPSPMTPSVWGRTAWKLAGRDEVVNADGTPPADGEWHRPTAATRACSAGALPRWRARSALPRTRPHIDESSSRGRDADRYGGHRAAALVPPPPGAVVIDRA